MPTNWSAGASAGFRKGGASAGFRAGASGGFKGGFGGSFNGSFGSHSGSASQGAKSGEQQGYQGRQSMDEFSIPNYPLDDQSIWNEFTDDNRPDDTPPNRYSPKQLQKTLELGPVPMTWQPVKISGLYPWNARDTDFMSSHVSIGNLVLPVEPGQVQVAHQKNIVRSDMSGREGSLKEIISLSDAVVTISTMYVHDPNAQWKTSDGENTVKSLDQQMQLVYEQFQRNERLPIICWDVNIHGFFYVVLQDFRVETVPQTPGMRRVTLTMLTDGASSIGEQYNDGAYKGTKDPMDESGSPWHLVRQKDTIYNLAKYHYGDLDQWERIWAYNWGVLGDDVSALEEGTRIVFPRLRTAWRRRDIGEQATTTQGVRTEYEYRVLTGVTMDDVYLSLTGTAAGVTSRDENLEDIGMRELYFDTMPIIRSNLNTCSRLFRLLDFYAKLGGEKRLERTFNEWLVDRGEIEPVPLLHRFSFDNRVEAEMLPGTDGEGAPFPAAGMPHDGLILGTKDRLNLPPLLDAWRPALLETVRGFWRGGTVPGEGDV